MSKQCICGICLTPPDAFTLDCKHILCCECCNVWSASKTCPRCHIENALDRLSTSGASEHALDRLVQIFCLRTKELSAAKQDVHPSESFSTSVLETSPSTRDDVVHKYKGDDMDSGSLKIRIGGRKRKAMEDDSGTQVDSDGEMQASDARKRQRTTATPDVECVITKERVLYRKTEELKTPLNITYADLKSGEKTYKEPLTVMKQQSEDMAKKTKDISSETLGEARRQADRIKGLVADLNNQCITRKLAAAKKTIQEFKSRAEEDKLALRKAEKRAIEFEAWGRQTKAHYQDIIRQMEANRPRSGNTTRSSTHVGEYPKELPTLRPVQALNDRDDNERNQCTPKKRRESAPIIMTPLRKTSNIHVELIQSRQQLAMLESE